MNQIFIYGYTFNYLFFLFYDLVTSHLSEIPQAIINFFFFYIKNSTWDNFEPLAYISDFDFTPHVVPRLPNNFLPG